MAPAGTSMETPSTGLMRADPANTSSVSEPQNNDTTEPGASCYVNYLGDDEGEAAPDAAYGAIYERLREVKRRYDPENLFRLNQKIVP